MEKIGAHVNTWLGTEQRHKWASIDKVRSDAGFPVKNFPDLMVKVAHLSFYNPSFALLYRGQTQDHKNTAGKSTLLPSIFRATGDFNATMAKERYDRLSKAEDFFPQLKKFKGEDRVNRHRILQWAILQHYEICHTPFLDVTHSLRVACTFSKMNHEDKDTFLYVLAVPHLAGCITTFGDQ